MQPDQSGNNAASQPCTSNSSCITDSVEFGCSNGMNGNVLHGNICSTKPVNLSVPTHEG